MGSQRVRRKRASSAVTWLLLLALVLSNAWWAVQMVDASITHTYAEDSRVHAERALSQSLAILPLVARGADRESVLATASSAHGTAAEAFEKEGYVWVGELGLRFDAQGRLVAVAKGWEPDDER